MIIYKIIWMIATASSEYKKQQILPGQCQHIGQAINALLKSSKFEQVDQLLFHINVKTSHPDICIAIRELCAGYHFSLTYLSSFSLNVDHAIGYQNRIHSRSRLSIFK